MKEKFYLISFLVLIIGSFFSCKKEKEVLKQEIDIGICLGAPKFYIAHGPLVTFHKNGGMVGIISDNNVGNNNGWCSCDSYQSIYGKGSYPDSIFAEWTDILTCNRYEGGLKLPSKLIYKLINQELKKKEQYNLFNFRVNFAPGGNFCVFLNDIVLKRGVANLIKIDTNCINQNGINKISNEYYKKVGLDYSNWQKSDPRYTLKGLGYIVKDTNIFFSSANLISKEGIESSNDFLNKSRKNKIYEQCRLNANSYKTIDDMEDKLDKFQLPVLIQLTWYKGKDFYNNTNISSSKDFYKYTNVPMPKDFVKQYTKPYINQKNGKSTNFNFLIFEVEKDGNHCVIWLDGPEKRKKIMRFKATDAIITKDSAIYVGGYAKNIEYFK